MRGRWRGLAQALVVVVLTACSSSRPPGMNDSTGATGGAGGQSCTTPGQGGCPCSQAGEAASCGDVVLRSGTYVSCSMGTSTCDGITWGPCVGNVVVTKSLAASPRATSGLHLSSLGTGGPCPAGSNPCDPYCNQTVDDPTSGFTPPAGFKAGPTGLTLSGTSSIACTGLTVTPSMSAVTVASLNPGTTITLTATAVPSGCATSPYTTQWTMDQPGQATISGTSNTNGQLTLQTPLPGTIHVTAYAAGVSGSAAITVKLDIVDTTGISPDTASATTQCGKFYTGGCAGSPAAPSGTANAGTVASTATWLYPYASTYFPLALPAPAVMYKYAAAPGTSPNSAVKLSLRYPAGTTEATSTFNYATLVSESTPDPRVYVLQAAWQRFEQAARGNDASLVIQRFAGGAAGVLEQETLETIHFVNGQLKGTVFYNSYSSPQGSNTGAVLSIAPGATSPTLAVQPSGTCTVCHSLNLDGSKLIANGGGAPGGSFGINSWDQSKRWNMAGGGFPSPPILDNYQYAGSGTDHDVPGNQFTFGAAWKDGSLYMTQGGSGTGDPNWRSPAAVSKLYDPGNPGTAFSVTNWPSNMEAVTPRFSPDGTKLAFGFWGGSALTQSSGTLPSDSSGKTLAVVDFVGSTGCSGGCSVSNARQVTGAAPGNSGLGKVGWPTFAPDGSAVVYQHQIVSSKAYISWSPSDINTVAGAQADLWISNVPSTSATTATPTRLNWLNGLNASGASYLPTTSRTVSAPTAYHSGNLNIGFRQADNCSNSGTAMSVYDNQLNYLPAINPTQAGGFNWVVFTSRRMYGNQAYANPWDADPNQTCSTCVTTAGALQYCNYSGQSCTIGTNCSAATPTKKLWVAALDGTYTPGTDPSHPAFYLPGQELAAGNSNGYWVNSACGAVGSTCSSNDDCCGGSGASPTNVCKITTAPSTKTCQAVGGACVAAGAVCNTAGSPGDCCNGLSCPAAGGLCFNPTTVVYTPQTYTREFVGTCPAGTHPVWRYFQWQATIPTNTSIAFSAQTKELAADTYAPAVPLNIGTATVSTPTPSWSQGPSTVDSVLVGAGLASKQYLLVSMLFTPNAGGSLAPSLQAWQQNYDCLASE